MSNRFIHNPTCLLAFVVKSTQGLWLAIIGLLFIGSTCLAQQSEPEVWPSQGEAREEVQSQRPSLLQPSGQSTVQAIPIAQTTDSKSTRVALKLHEATKISSSQQIGTTEFKMAAQPRFGEQADHGEVQVDSIAHQVPPSLYDFGPTPVDSTMPYEASNEMWVYEGKKLNANRRPLIELGRPWYQLGQFPAASTILGRHNPVSPQFIVYGDFRTAYANNRNSGTDERSLFATELNLNFDLRLTGTERFTAFVAPSDRANQNTRWLTDEDVFIDELDFDVEFGMFEGDLGALVGGAVGQTLPFDLPFAVGVMPLLFQNGVWMEDAVLGVAATLPARNSPKLDISNMDITFFAAYDNIDSPAFPADNDVAKMYGMASWIEAAGGYIELNYAFLEDRDRVRDRSYHNIGFAFSRRYGRWISNSVRVIANAGQATTGGPNTADGVLVLLENSLITSRPQTFVPYMNLFAGFDRPQSAARAIVAGGILRNTGILFETDGLTGYPTLDDTANDTWGGAMGLNIISENFDQQLILEVAALQVMNHRNQVSRNAFDDQYGAGLRYQIPLSNALILRADAMYGVLRKVDDIHGFRTELRWKF